MFRMIQGFSRHGGWTKTWGLSQLHLSRSLITSVQFINMLFRLRKTRGILVISAYTVVKACCRSAFGVRFGKYCIRSKLRTLSDHTMLFLKGLIWNWFCSFGLLGWIGCPTLRNITLNSFHLLVSWIKRTTTVNFALIIHEREKGWRLERMWEMRERRREKVRGGGEKTRGKVRGEGRGRERKWGGGERTREKARGEGRGQGRKWGGRRVDKGKVRGQWRGQGGKRDEEEVKRQDEEEEKYKKIWEKRREWYWLHVCLIRKMLLTRVILILLSIERLHTLLVTCKLQREMNI